MSLMAWGGFLAAAWQMITGKWSKHLILFGWTLLYFSWQSMAFNPTMRYQILIYPVLAIFAGWGVIFLIDAARGVEIKNKLHRLLVPAAGLVGAAALLLTAAWAFSFVQIYIRPVTRVAASNWIYQNLPGPLTLPVDTGEEIFNQPLTFNYDFFVTPDRDFISSFQPKQAGVISEIAVHTIVAAGEQRNFNLWVGERADFSLAQLSLDEIVDFGQTNMPLFVSLHPGSFFGTDPRCRICIQGKSDPRAG